MRRREGWREALVEVEVVAEPVMIEGVVGRSKGLLTDRMVSREDLAWLFREAEPVGKRVRLRGQPRTYRCPPQVQYLIEGTIPMFDVGRGELVK